MRPQSGASAAVVGGPEESGRGTAVLVADGEAEVQVAVEAAAGKEKPPALHPVQIVRRAVEAGLVEADEAGQRGIETRQVGVPVVVGVEDVDVGEEPREVLGGDDAPSAHPGVWLRTHGASTRPGAAARELSAMPKEPGPST